MEFAPGCFSSCEVWPPFLAFSLGIPFEESQKKGDFGAFAKLS